METSNPPQSRLDARGNRYFPQFYWTGAIGLVAAAAYVIWRSLDLLRLAWPISIDDAFITLRYGRHWAEGHGIVWNVGEGPVEGYSNFLFVILARIAVGLGGDPLLAAKLAGVFGYAATLVLIAWIAARWTRPGLALLAAASFALYMGAAHWAGSGMETMAYVAIMLGGIGLALGLVSDGQPGRRTVLKAALASVLMVLGALTRPEAPVIWLGLMAWLAWESQRNDAVHWRDKTGPLLALALPFLLLYGPYFLWRWHHFGLLFPHPIYCKSGGAMDRFNLHHDFIHVAWPALLLAIPALPLGRMRRTAPFWLVIVVYWIILVGVDDVAAHYIRHFMLAYAALLILAAIGAGNLLNRLPSRRIGTVLVLAALAFVAWQEGLALPSARKTLTMDATDMARRKTSMKEMALWFKTRLGPEDRVVLGEAGVIPYYSDVRVTDCLCLNNPAMTRPPIGYSLERFVDSVFEDPPEMVIVPSFDYSRLSVPSGSWGDVYMALLTHPYFNTHYQLVRKAGYEGGVFTFWAFERLDHIQKQPAPPTP